MEQVARTVAVVRWLSIADKGDIASGKQIAVDRIALIVHSNSEMEVVNSTPAAEAYMGIVPQQALEDRFEERTSCGVFLC